MILKLILNGLVFILTIASGVWLSKLGKPYNSQIFNLHKLIALGFIIYTFVIGKNMIKSIDINGLMWLLIIVSIIFVIALITTGGILSIKDKAKNLWILAHTISSIFLFVSVSAWFHLC